MGEAESGRREPPSSQQVGRLWGEAQSVPAAPAAGQPLSLSLCFFLWPGHSLVLGPVPAFLPGGQRDPFCKCPSVGALCLSPSFSVLLGGEAAPLLYGLMWSMCNGGGASQTEPEQPIWGVSPEICRPEGLLDGGPSVSWIGSRCSSVVLPLSPPPLSLSCSWPWPAPGSSLLGTSQAAL